MPVRVLKSAVYWKFCNCDQVIS